MVAVRVSGDTVELASSQESLRNTPGVVGGCWVTWKVPGTTVWKAVAPDRGDPSRMYWVPAGTPFTVPSSGMANLVMFGSWNGSLGVVWFSMMTVPYRASFTQTQRTVSSGATWMVAVRGSRATVELASSQESLRNTPGVVGGCWVTWKVPGTTVWKAVAADRGDPSRMYWVPAGTPFTVPSSGMANLVMFGSWNGSLGVVWFSMMTVPYRASFTQTQRTVSSGAT